MGSPSETAPPTGTITTPRDLPRLRTSHRLRVVEEVGWGSLPEAIAADLRRATERLRGLSQAQLSAPAPPHASRAEAGRATAQQLAETAQGIAARDDDAEPHWRALPVLGDFTVGDQLAVVGHDLVAELAGCGPDVDVWARGSRRTAREAVTAAAATLAATRRLL